MEIDGAFKGVFIEGMTRVSKIYREGLSLKKSQKAQANGKDQGGIWQNGIIVWDKTRMKGYLQSQVWTANKLYAETDYSNWRRHFPFPHSKHVVRNGEGSDFGNPFDPEDNFLKSTDT